MDKLRLRFSKTGRSVYISHLDLMRTLQRALMRAEIPIRYSEGFNPHAIMSIALPLSVGAESLCELMDFKLRSFMSMQEITYRLNRTLPEGLQAIETYEWERKFKEIKWIDIEGVFEYDNRDMGSMLEGVAEFFQQESIVIEKRTKRGIGESNIAPAIRSISFDAGEKTLSLQATISAQEPTLNPEYLSAALSQLVPELAPDFAYFKRRSLFDAEMCEFR